MNYGKKWEEIFKEDWKKTFPNKFILRLKDDTSGYAGASKNPCDYLTLVSDSNKTNLFMIECKCHKDNTFPFSAFSQYDDLKEYAGMENVQAGVMLWFIDHDVVTFVPIETFIKLKHDNKKSFHYNMIEGDEYPSIILPVEKKRVFVHADYTIMKGLVK